MDHIDNYPAKSVSEIFVEAASDLVAETGVNPDSDRGRRLRAEVIRHYEMALHETRQSALFSGMHREARDIAPEKIKTVNSYMRGWLANYATPENG
ncbi:MAG: hypothetical protein ACLFR0_09570 [Alphaproteobacteria bacterium]